MTGVPVPNYSEEELDSIPSRLNLEGCPYVLLRLHQHEPGRVKLTVYGGGPGIDDEASVQALLTLALRDLPEPVTELRSTGTLSTDGDEAVGGGGAVDLTLNPDCEQGKHTACSGDAWDHAADELCACACPCHVNP